MRNNNNSKKKPSISTTLRSRDEQHKVCMLFYFHHRSNFICLNPSCRAVRTPMLCYMWVHLYENQTHSVSITGEIYSTTWKQYYTLKCNHRKVFHQKTHITRRFSIVRLCHGECSSTINNSIGAIHHKVAYTIRSHKTSHCALAMWNKEARSKFIKIDGKKNTENGTKTLCHTGATVRERASGWGEWWEQCAFPQNMKISIAVWHRSRNSPRRLPSLCVRWQCIVVTVEHIKYV